MHVNVSPLRTRPCRAPAPSLHARCFSRRPPSVPPPHFHKGILYLYHYSLYSKLARSCPGRSRLRPQQLRTFAKWKSMECPCRLTTETSTHVQTVHHAKPRRCSRSRSVWRNPLQTEFSCLRITGIRYRTLMQLVVLPDLANSTPTMSPNSDSRAPKRRSEKHKNHDHTPRTIDL